MSYRAYVTYGNTNEPISAVVQSEDSQTQEAVFNMEGSTAVLSETIGEIDPETLMEMGVYARGLPFVQAVELNPEESNE